MQNEIVKNEETPVFTPSTDPITLISQGIERGLTIEMMQQLYNLRKEWKAEIAQEAFDQALADFQAECPVIEKDKDVIFNGKVQYSYAPLDSIVRQVRGLLGKHGFSYSFKLEETETGIKAFCFLKHRLGHVEVSDFTADMKGTNMMSNAQVVSSKATFAKRNAFCNVTGIVTGDEDNDAVKSPEEAKNETLLTQEQRDQISELAQKAGVTMADVATRCRADYGASLTDITATQAMGIIDRLNLKIKNTKPTA